MNDTVSGINKKRIRFTFFVLAIAIAAAGLTAESTYQISRLYLNKAEKRRSTEAIRFYETANLFWAIPDGSLLRLADLQYGAGDYQSARDNYGLMETKAAYLGSTKAEYALGEYTQITETDGTNHQSIETDQRLLLVAKSYLKLGRLENARKVLIKISTDLEARDLDSLLLGNATPISSTEALKRLGAETNLSNRYILAFNELQRRGFPQAAVSLLREGFTKDHLTRDGLLALAQAQNDLHDYTGAEQSLLRAVSFDAYYPQTFNQLVITENKLGKTSKANEYSSYLASISW